MTLLRSIGRYLIYFILLALILYQLGFGNVLSNLLVTAGFGSLAISFGAQSIVKDMVTGFFMMFEKQYAVGDFVKIGDYEGTVTSIAMRVTYLQNFKGQRIIIPNGSITNVINYSSEFSMAMVTIPTPYEADTLRLINLTEQVIKLYAQDNADVFLEQPQVQGISNLNTSSVDLLITAKVKPLTQWKTERELRLRIKECFDQNNISIPYQQIVIRQPEKDVKYE
ncbi:Small-conductance mechanosensitive channel [bioreactor metagenome]|uniref:Small-conductance mechanosensitive channel n=1 Tax=bioreactor metagenome TaxID=1076179 RepID=A0A645A238_9ZZZZ